MTKFIIDAALRSKLHNLTEPLELCDESGRILGHIFPASDLSEYDLTEPPISEDELQRREQSDEWYTTEQVLQRLKNLENQ